MADKKTLSPEEKKLAAEKHVDELVQKALVALEEMRKLNQVREFFYQPFDAFLQYLKPLSFSRTFSCFRKFSRIV